jgi:hypothetical protein
MRREQVTSTFSLLRNGGAAGDTTAEAGSVSGAGAGGSLKPKSVRSDRSGAKSSGFSAAAALAAASVRFRFFAMGVFSAGSEAAAEIAAKKPGDLREASTRLRRG